ncbi:hypothetical protein P3S68_002155 [Capsicum galapagoense]
MRIEGLAVYMMLLQAVRKLVVLLDFKVEHWYSGLGSAARFYQVAHLVLPEKHLLHQQSSIVLSWISLDCQGSLISFKIALGPLETSGYQSSIL